VEYVYFAKHGSEYAIVLVEAEEVGMIIPDKGVVVSLHPSDGEAVPAQEPVAIFFGE